MRDAVTIAVSALLVLACGAFGAAEPVAGGVDAADAAADATTSLDGTSADAATDSATSTFDCSGAPWLCESFDEETQLPAIFSDASVDGVIEVLFDPEARSAPNFLRAGASDGQRGLAEVVQPLERAGLSCEFDIRVAASAAAVVQLVQLDLFAGTAGFAGITLQVDDSGYKLSTYGQFSGGALVPPTSGSVSMATNAWTHVRIDFLLGPDPNVEFRIEGATLIGDLAPVDGFPVPATARLRIGVTVVSTGTWDVRYDNVRCVAVD